ncbi:MAG: hypothetical protein C5B44_00330, partial [Acidobacteria bacterium]
MSTAEMQTPSARVPSPLERLRTLLSPTGNTGDAIFKATMFSAALLLVILVGAMVVALASDSMLSIKQFGFGFLTRRDWNPISGQFG